MEKITYTKVDEKGMHSLVNIPWNIAITKGMNLKENGSEYTIYECDKLKFLVHKYGPLLTSKLNGFHKLMISEMYKIDPSMCIDMVELYGGLEYLSDLIKSYEQSFTEMYERLQSEE
jgi:hypothetical protein